jgi:hypothetical protein
MDASWIVMTSILLHFAVIHYYHTEREVVHSWCLADQQSTKQALGNSVKRHCGLDYRLDFAKDFG